MKIADINVRQVYRICFPDDNPFFGEVIVKEKARVLIETESGRVIAIDPRVIEEC